MDYSLRNNMHGKTLEKHLEEKSKDLSFYLYGSGRRNWETLFSSPFVDTQQKFKKTIEEMVCSNNSDSFWRATN